MRMSFASVVGVDEEPALNDTAFRFKSDIARARIITRAPQLQRGAGAEALFQDQSVTTGKQFYKMMQRSAGIVESARQFCGLWHSNKKEHFALSVGQGRTHLEPVIGNNISNSYFATSL